MVNHWYRRGKDWAKDSLKEMSAAHHSEHSVGLGFALGTFFNIVAPGLSILLAILLILLYRNLNKLSFFVALAFWNPITLPPVYFLSYRISDRFFGPLPPLTGSMFSYHSVFQMSRMLLLGNLLVGAAVSLLSYVAVSQAVVLYRAYKARRSA